MRDMSDDEGPLGINDLFIQNKSEVRLWWFEEEPIGDMALVYSKSVTFQTSTKNRSYVTIRNGRSK